MRYVNYFFDCDGVILDSNLIKGDCFYEVAASYSREKAQEATQYYKSTAGTPRIDKVHYFFETLLRQKRDLSIVSEFLEAFNTRSFNKLCKCNHIQDIEKFLSKIKTKEKFVVSGAPQDELRVILEAQKLSNNFKEILGSPELKHINLKNLIDKYSIDTEKSVFFGDSQVDYESAAMFNIDFVFVAEKTEFKNYKEYFKDKNIKIIKNFTELL